MQRKLIKVEDIMTEGITQTLRNLAVNTIGVVGAEHVNKRSLRALTSYLKKTEGIIVKTRSVKEEVWLKRLV